MMRVRKPALLALIAGFVVASAPIDASATSTLPSSPSASLRPPSYLIVESFNVTAPAGQQTFGSVNCPANAAGKVRYPYGGGVTINSSNLSVNINSSYPSGTAWHAYVNNASGSDITFDVWATCALQKLASTSELKTCRGKGFACAKLLWSSLRNAEPTTSTKNQVSARFRKSNVLPAKF